MPCVNIDTNERWKKKIAYNFSPLNEKPLCWWDEIIDGISIERKRLFGAGKIFHENNAFSPRMRSRSRQPTQDDVARESSRAALRQTETKLRVCAARRYRHLQLLASLVQFFLFAPLRKTVFRSPHMRFHSSRSHFSLTLRNIAIGCPTNVPDDYFFRPLSAAFLLRVLVHNRSVTKIELFTNWFSSTLLLSLVLEAPSTRVCDKRLLRREDLCGACKQSAKCKLCKQSLIWIGRESTERYSWSVIAKRNQRISSPLRCSNNKSPPDERQRKHLWTFLSDEQTVLKLMKEIRDVLVKSNVFRVWKVIGFPISLIDRPLAASDLVSIPRPRHSDDTQQAQLHSRQFN